MMGRRAGQLEKTGEYCINWFTVRPFYLKSFYYFLYQFLYLFESPSRWELVSEMLDKIIFKEREKCKIKEAMPVAFHFHIYIHIHIHAFQYVYMPISHSPLYIYEAVKWSLSGWRVDCYVKWPYSGSHIYTSIMYTPVSIIWSILCGCIIVKEI